jgi:hypothetical protein
MLLQRRDRLERLVGAGAPPVLAQSSPTLCRPFDDEAHRPGRELARDDREILDADLNLAAGIQRVEMRILVIVVVDVDLDPVELADARHAGSSSREQAGGPTRAYSATIIRRFTDQGILQEMTGQRRNREFRYAPYLVLFQVAESPGAGAEA